MNRATPARLFKLYKEMSEAQRKLVSDAGFGGLLEIGSGRLPSALSKWLVKNVDGESEELVIPGRGKIKVNAAAVNRILGLPMGEDEVKYEFNGSAISFINEKCSFDNGRSPAITTITERLCANKEANDDYLRCWLMVAISTFLCGSTALCISPKCYPSLVDLSKVKELNWCKFVVDTLKGSVGKMHKKDSVLGCLYFLSILYLDSLEVGNIQVPEKQPRVAAWNMKLINKVIKMDTNTNGTFGKLKLKKLAGSVTETSLFGDFQDIDNFISHRASAPMSSKKKRKLSEVVKKACIGFTEVIGTFISEVSTISDDSEDQEEPRRSTRRRTTKNHQQNVDDEDEEIEEDEEEEDWKEDEDEDEEDEEADKEAELEDKEVDKEVELEDKSVSDEDDATNIVDPPLEVVPSQSKRERLR
ncbi:hypothetical protein SORBI_3004G029800 [Sorghum bicolor]|uniref:Aminotransferase-like plant mobile domain-containing protein n=1 Tax=Sorghum bicolor TaxID=4558 RepID=A0A194YNH8_SORBI|nr:hypothetical protein SORBI_3004G029800 [Sorghum bicolor]